MPRVRVDDLEMYYEVHGNRFPLVLISGYSGSSESWDVLVPRVRELTKHYKVVTLDNRGTGRSSALEGDYSIKTMGDDVAGLLDSRARTECRLGLTINMLAPVLQHLYIMALPIVRKTSGWSYKVQSRPFENVKNQIGYCGLWCGSCIVGNGTLRELTKTYEHLIEGYGVNEWGAKDFDSKEFMKGLASIQNLPICPGCLKGGGNDECKIRPCASKKEISDCNECKQPATCKNLEALQKVRTGALGVGMLIKAGKGGQSQLKEKWTAEIRNKFPYCVIDI